jgi:hypothetical protein
LLGNSQRPEDLWQWLQKTSTELGTEFLAIQIRVQVAEDWERDRTEFARSKGLSKLASEYKIERKDLAAESAKR